MLRCADIPSALAEQSVLSGVVRVVRVLRGSFELEVGAKRDVEHALLAHA